MARAIPTNRYAIQLAIFVAFGMCWFLFLLYYLYLTPKLGGKIIQCRFGEVLTRQCQYLPGFLFGYDIGVISVSGSFVHQSISHNARRDVWLCQTSFDALGNLTLQEIHFSQAQGSQLLPLFCLQGWFNSRANCINCSLMASSRTFVYAYRKRIYYVRI
jgi:hypothetical protein